MIALPDTINIHITRSCNFTCRYCYAGFEECNANSLSHQTVLELLAQIASAPPLPCGRPRKVNFAGGEPLLINGLSQIVRQAKAVGLVTSIVTNGSLLTPQWLGSLRDMLDICTLSIDSASATSNAHVGRYNRKCIPDGAFYQQRASWIRAAGIRLKINTVVNQTNSGEDLGELIASIDPFRWKILQAKKIIGQNDRAFDQLAVTLEEFSAYVRRNRVLVPTSIAVIAETADDMTDSYAMIAPNGSFFGNGTGTYRYSRPIVDVGIEAAFADVSFSPDRFRNRGGVYA